MTDPTLGAEATRYLRRFRWALSDLPESERDEIAAELSGHIGERVDEGAKLSEVLAALGPAEDYARAFITERKASVAIATRSLPNLISALVVRAGSSITSLISVVGLAAVWMVAFVLLVVAVMKIFDPAHIGLWQSETEFYFGFHTRPDEASELLGLWLFPTAIAFALGAAYATRLAALFVLRRGRSVE